jgi:hypothetical protein
MKRSIFALALVVPIWVFVANAQDATPGPAILGERSVVIPRDNTPFSVGEDEIVRLIVSKAVAEAKIEVIVAGPGKIVAENRLSYRHNGKPQTAHGHKEYEIKPTGKGKVTATITITPPQPGPSQTVTTYEFDVK